MKRKLKNKIEHKKNSENKPLFSEISVGDAIILSGQVKKIENSWLEIELSSGVKIWIPQNDITMNNGWLVSNAEQLEK